VRELTKLRAPDLVPIVDSLCTGTFLLLSEWEAFVLHRTEIRDALVRYEGVSLVPSNRPNLPLFEALRSGNRVEVRDDLVLVFEDDDIRWVEECRSDAFAPRIPIVLNFAAPEGD
jgi:hypothetical protein